jgi:hypothetical protein
MERINERTQSLMAQMAPTMPCNYVCPIKATAREPTKQAGYI